MPAPLRALLLAVGFATRVPVRVDKVEVRDLAAAISCFPLLGVAIGALCLGVYELSAAAFGPLLAAVSCVACAALITGGLHLDGLADLFDALGGGRGDRKRMLEIMRDPRVGAHGASALVLVLMAKVIAVAQLPADARWAGLCGAAAIARLMAVWLLFGLPPARTDGLGHDMGAGLRAGHMAFATGTFLILSVLLGPLLLTAALASVAVALGLGWLARARLGGVTGDVCGATIELAELAFLLVCGAGSVRSGLM
jgi:adenosylcobinamide-GDP ribazoletransferase